MHEPTEAEADQLLTVRTLLDTGAARLTTANADSAGITVVDELCEEGEEGQKAADDDMDGAVALNARFHAKIMELAGNTVRAERAAQVDRRVRWDYTPVTPRRGRQSWIEHRAHIGAIASDDEQRAAEVMRARTEHTGRTYHARAMS